MILDENKQPACTEKSVAVSVSQLPLCCPGDGMSVWNAHPKVYLDLATQGEVICPYCGTRYLLNDE